MVRLRASGIPRKARLDSDTTTALGNAKRGILQGTAQSRHQSAGQLGGSRNADLLAQNGSDSHFEAVPSAGNTQTGTLRNGRESRGSVAKWAEMLAG